MRGWRLTSLLVVCCLALVGVGQSVADTATAAAKSCEKGRTLLQCGEKIGIFDDSYGAAIGGFGDLILFETKLPLPLGNPALSQFWKYQTATSLARVQFESGINNQLLDENIEQVPQRAKLSTPVVHASGVVDRRAAGALSSLLRAEQQQVVNLAAMNTALNRATAAQTTRTRSDWMNYQLSAAGGFALHAAAATRRMIRFQRRAERALVHSNLLFGVGPVDLRLAKRKVRRTKRIARSIATILQYYGITGPLLGTTAEEFLLADLGPTSVSLSQYLGSSTLTLGERHLIRALRHFAARIPHHGRPPVG